MRTLTLRGEEETRAFAEDLAAGLRPNDVVALVGDLGTGKTTMTKYIAAALGVTEPVTSPTFTIVQEHRSGRLPPFHFDVYRVDSPQEILDVGADEYFDAGGICVIEWADRIADLLPDETKVILLRYGEKEGERILTCTF